MFLRVGDLKDGWRSEVHKTLSEHPFITPIERVHVSGTPGSGWGGVVDVGTKETDKKNAIRHFLWQVSLAHILGMDIAVELGDAHEAGESCREGKP